MYKLIGKLFEKKNPDATTKSLFRYMAMGGIAWLLISYQKGDLQRHPFRSLILSICAALFTGVSHWQLEPWFPSNKLRDDRFSDPHT